MAIITRHGKWLLKVYFATARPLIRNDAFRTPSLNSKEMTKVTVGRRGEGRGSTKKKGNRKLSLSCKSCGRQQKEREREGEHERQLSRVILQLVSVIALHSSLSPTAPSILVVFD